METAAERKQRKKRVDWTPQELDQVASKVVQLIIYHPDYTAAQLIQEGQEGLPEDRRRPAGGFSQAKPLYEVVKKKLAALYENRIEPKTTGDQDLTQQLEAAKKEIADLEQELSDQETVLQEREEQLNRLSQEIEDKNTLLQEKLSQPPPPTVDDLLLTVPTEKLLAVLFTRVTAGLHGDKILLTQLFQNQTDEMKQQVEKLTQNWATERHRLETRMHSIQGTLNEVTRKGDIPLVPVPSGATPSSYMPLFIVAVEKRDDYQRLHNALQTARVRIQKLDITKKGLPLPSFTEDDRVVVWKRGVPQDVVRLLQDRVKPPRLMVCDCTLSEMATQISKEAESIREKKATTVPVATNGVPK